jgi:hypothetical protein
MGIARSRNRGSVGRCQLRYCQGLIRSALSQRLMVEAEMRRTMRRWMTVRASSAADQRESGRPESRGRVQARAVTCSLTLEGEKAGRAPSRGFREGRPGPAPLTPFAHGPICAAHRAGNGGVAPVGVLIGQEQDLRPHHPGMRGRTQTGKALERLVFGGRERDLMPRLGSSAQGAIRSVEHLGSTIAHTGSRAQKPGTNL